MNYELRVQAGEARVDLSREADFRLGTAFIQPSLCRFDVSGGSEQVEPRVMQVLVALAREDRVVSRDDLGRLCWDGRIVTPGAINRCVGEVRKLGERGAFAVETIPRVGYRLKRLDIEPAEPAAVTNETVAGSGAGAQGAIAISGLAPLRQRAVVIGAVIGLAAACLAVATIVLWPSPPYWQVLEERPLIATPLRERHPAISHDGQMIAYSAGADAVHLNIYFRRISGTASVRLTQEPDAEWPSWSPFDDRIAYVAYAAGMPCRIRTVEVPAGVTREVGRCKGEERPRVTWSPDGAALYFSDRPSIDQPARIVRLDLSSGAYRDITKPPGNTTGDSSATASPDGRWIGFARCIGQESCALVIHDLENGRERNLAFESGSGPAWSSDSRMMFAATAQGAGYAIWQIPVDGSARRQLTANSDRLARLSAGPGGLLVAEIRRISIGLARPPSAVGGDAQWIEQGKSGAATTEVPSTDNWSPAVSADGTIAVASSRSGTFGIWVLRGETAHQIVDLGVTNASFLRWSPDATRLAFVVRPPKQNALIEIVNADGAYPRRVGLDASQVGPLSWSGDGRAIFYSARDGKGWRLWRLDTSGSGARSAISGYGWQAVQADGDRLYAVREGTRGFWLFGPSPKLLTTEWPRAAPFPAEAPFQWLAFKGDIFFTDFTDIHRARLVAVSTSGGPPRVLYELPRMTDIISFALDPRDGKPVYPAIASIESDIELFRLERR